MTGSSKHGRRDEPLTGRQTQVAETTVATTRVRLGAKAMVWADDKVLLVEERRADGSTFWTLPGGGVTIGESPADCLRREVAEELHSRITLQRPVTACTYRHSSDPGLATTYVVFAGRLTDPPVPAWQEGVIDARWVPSDDPPETTLAPFRRVLGRVGSRETTVRID